MRSGAHPTTRMRAGRSLAQRVWFYRYAYVLMLPGLVYFFIFQYLPMWGVLIAFEDFRPWQGPFASPWVGFAHFTEFFNSVYFGRLLRNTLLIGLLNLVFVFPAPIVLAILLNEVRSQAYRKFIQTISYLPHFVSWVVVGGMLIYLFSVNVGLLTAALAQFDLSPLPVIGSPSAFLPLVVGTALWKEIGFTAIIFLAAIADINPELYEAAIMDGANRLQRARHVTIPSIAHVIVIMLILQIGVIMSTNFQQILILLGNDAGLYEVGDVIDTWVYRAGFFQQQFSLATAVGLFKGVIGLALILSANAVCRRVVGHGLW
jgi:putative aldouronate transport system permease protein